MKNDINIDNYLDPKSIESIEIKLPTVFSNERSEEVYFGNDAPLRNTLIELATYLKENIAGNSAKFKDEKFVKEVKRNCDLYSKAIAKDINAEEVYFSIKLDKIPNAYCYNMLIDDNTRIVNDKRVVDMLKIYDMESIIKTKTGYQFANKKNKYILIICTDKLIEQYDIMTLAGILCHEMGHCFEMGVFGSLKLMSDEIYKKVLDDTDKRIELLGDDFKLFQLKPTFIPFRNIIVGFINHILYMLFRPDLGIKSGIFTKVYLFFTKNYTFLEDDSARLTDINSKKNITNKKISNVLLTVTTDRKKRLNDIAKEIEDEYKDYKVPNEKTDKTKAKKHLKISLLKILNMIRVQIYFFDTNVLEALTLSSYSRKAVEKKANLRKYENFADTFATSYGFGSDLAKFVNNIDESETHSPKYLDHMLYKIPILNIFTYSNQLVYNHRMNYKSSYGNDEHRIESIYKSLYFELKNNKELSIAQKQDIRDQMKSVEETYKSYQQNKRVYGFFINFIDKLISRKLKNEYNDKDEIMDILVPMDSVLEDTKQVEENKKSIK